MSISVYNHIGTVFMTHGRLRYMRSISVHGLFRYIRRSVHGPLRYITTSMYKIAFKWREGMSGLVVTYARNQKCFMLHYEKFCKPRFSLLKFPLCRTASIRYSCCVQASHPSHDTVCWFRRTGFTVRCT